MTTVGATIDGADVLGGLLVLNVAALLVLVSCVVVAARSYRHHWPAVQRYARMIPWRPVAWAVLGAWPVAALLLWNLVPIATLLLWSAARCALQHTRGETATPDAAEDAPDSVASILRRHGQAAVHEMMMKNMRRTRPTEPAEQPTEPSEPAEQPPEARHDAASTVRQRRMAAPD